jgi:hypothetical protein
MTPHTNRNSEEPELIAWIVLRLVWDEVDRFGIFTISLCLKLSSG